MARKRRTRRGELEKAIKGALAPGDFIGYRDSSDFLGGVEAAKRKVVALIKAGDPGRAVVLLEAFIAGCYEKSEEIDDSGGSFGMFVEELFCDWIRARQKSKASADETAHALFSWMDSDNYGYCYGLEKTAVKVLNRDGLRAFERAVEELSGEGDGKSYAHRRKVEILKAIHGKRRDVDAYAAVCGDDLAPKDCEVLADLCVKRRRPEEALGWVERRLELEKNGRWPNRSAWRLPQLQREILKELGRGGDALASAWQGYEQAPSEYAYDDLMKGTSIKRGFSAGCCFAVP